MQSLSAFVVALFVAASCIGGGSALLAACGLRRSLPLSERLAFSFATGMALLGWLVFLPAVSGLLNRAALAVICVAMLAGLTLVRGGQEATSPPRETIGALGWGLIAAIAFIMGIDVLEALSPPAEADSLAYHFALPERYLNAGSLEFVPRAVDGAIPQLVHMTYTAALGLGGEQTLTFWTMLSGWATAGLLYTVARRWLSLQWALAVTLLYISLPTVLQTGGTGQIETRVAQFVILGALACGVALRHQDARWAALAGFCAGAFAGAKLTGLVFGLVCGLAVLAGRGGIRRGFAYGACALVMACQWYGWNWWHTGDPVFPMLYAVLGTNDPDLWSQALSESLRQWVDTSETPLPATIAWFLAFPFYTTFIYNSAMETGRTGLGYYAVLALPFAAGWLWSRRFRFPRNELAIAGYIVVACITIWFFAGLPQRVRHLLPFIPVIMLCLTAAAVAWSSAVGVGRPLAAGTALCIAVQCVGQLVYGANYARYVFTSESRNAFMLRNVSRYGLVPWTNAHVSETDRVLVFDRQLIYPLKPQARLAHKLFRKSLNPALYATNPAQFYADLEKFGITHILAVDGESGRPEPVAAETAMAARLVAAGCAQPIHRGRVAEIPSRTLAAAPKPVRDMTLYRVVAAGCRFAHPR